MSRMTQSRRTYDTVIDYLHCRENQPSAANCDGGEAQALPVLFLLGTPGTERLLCYSPGVGEEETALSFIS